MEFSSKRNSTSIECIFIADIYKADASNKGGAENNDSVLIEHLENNNFIVRKVYAHLIDATFVDTNRHKPFLVSNFVLLSGETKAALAKVHYIIYEHDHKYVITRDPSKYPNFKIPTKDIADRPFYSKAQLVICLSNIQAKCMKETLGLSNIVSIGTSLWSQSKLKFIEDLSFAPKTKEVCIVNSSNPTKGTREAIDFCTKHKLTFDIIESTDEKEFLRLLSSYKVLVFIPTVLESLCRLVVEAKMLNCKVHTKPHLLGAASEDWFTLSGTDLIQTIRLKQKSALDLFVKQLS
tara:strand:- start:4074 stop:4952 length:879 start_codon:yes stop_codon:yes gene_type:complete